MVPPPRAGTFSPSPAQSLQTGGSHSPHPAQNAALSASPITGSPTGTTSVSKIVIAQVFVLLSSIKEEKDDSSKWEQLRKLIDESGMEVFTKYFARLVASSASQIFPGLNRPGGTPGTYQLLTSEMQKISHDPEQARRIAESIEAGTEDIFRDFDLSTFMEYFKLDALEKTILALAFKLGSRSDLRTKADAILSRNFSTCTNIMGSPAESHGDLSPEFLSLIVDRFIQLHPPNFSGATKSELTFRVTHRYDDARLGPPPEPLAALDLMRVLVDKPANALTLYIQKTGADFTRDEDTCATHLQNRTFGNIGEDMVSAALTYTTVSQTPAYNPSVLVAALRRVVPATFRWQDVITYFDERNARKSPPQFLRLYNALVPIARDDSRAFDIQHLWGGNWENPEAQLSFICAFASLSTEQLDATTIPGLQSTFSLENYAQSSPEVKERAAEAVKHPLVSLAAISAIFHVALVSQHASTNNEARRLFEKVVVPNLDIFVVSAFGVPKPWPATASETINSLFEKFLKKRQPGWDFVFDSLWRKDKEWVMERLIEAHAAEPGELPIIFEHAVKHGWLNELIYLPNGFGLDLVAYAHGQGYVDLTEWGRNNADRSTEIARPLMQFLVIKSDLETQRVDGQPVPSKTNVPLKVRTVSALLNILEDFLPKTPIPDLVMLQRQCIAIYPRLINYGEGFDEIIEASEKDSHALPQEANSKMEEHFKRMYSNEIEVREVVGIMDHYKHSRDPLEQDVFACMINSLFEEYSHFGDYPLEALATTAVLFGGIISHKLISDLPLKVGLGMILEAVKEHKQEHPMFKFGMQALMQLYSRFREWPGFCSQLLQCASLRGTEAWKKADEIVRETSEEAGLGRPPGSGEAVTNGNSVDEAAAEPSYAPFASINVDPAPTNMAYEDPDSDVQGKVQFVLNNITASTLQAMFLEIRPMLEAKHQQWFASHLVEERAKMQPNYHQVYLQLVSHFEDKALWAEILRETYVSVARMLNSEATLQNSTDRTHLKNLGGWLGLLTLARDKPIRQKNVAFKQLLIEAHDTKRLIVAIPFVCKVLSQGEHSNVFKPPNPWLMDIVHFLIDLYHNAELKLNLKFEIEVLCQTLSIDHKSIEPSGEILNRMAAEEAAELPPDALEYDNLPLNGLVSSGVNAGMSAHNLGPNANAMLDMIPGLITKVNVPSVSDMVIDASTLEGIVKDALTRALQDIIQPVVDRSVAIAAIATQQMIRKDFATEPDENRVRTAAVNMVKATAGSLALVTSKEPLRANFTNYMRSLSSESQQGLPEGTIIMCVNSNLDNASNIIEKATQDRAMVEIQEMMEPELEMRRRHRIQRPNEAYVDSSLSRWAMTIPNPFKLSPNINGLNSEQMAIYDDFARHPRPPTAGAGSASHVQSASDATRSLANEVLQDQYGSLTNVPTPAETPSVTSLGSQMQQYPHVHNGVGAGGVVGGMVNGRQAVPPVDVRLITDRISKLVMELQRAATDASEEHFLELPRPHPVLDVIDALVQTIIKAQQTAEDFVSYAAEQVCQMLVSQIEDSLTLESLVHVLETLRKIANGTSLSNRVTHFFHSQPAHTFLNLPLVSALLNTDLLDWPSIDAAMASALKQRKEGSIMFLMRLLDLALNGETPLALYADFVYSLAEAWAWVGEDPDVPGGQEFKAKVLAPVSEPPSPSLTQEQKLQSRRIQMAYVFDEWTHLCQKPRVPESIPFIFVEQMRAQRIVSNRDDLFDFLRLAVDKAVDRYEVVVNSGGTTAEAYSTIDSVPKLIAVYVQAAADSEGGPVSARAELMDSILALAVMIFNHHFVKRGELFNQRVFFRLFSMLLFMVDRISDRLSDTDLNEMMLRFGTRFNDLGPVTFPFFAFGWAELIKHRLFLPAMLRMPGHAGWPRLTKIIRQLFFYVGEQLKAPEVASVIKDLYRASVKLVLIIYHDFPEYLAANHVALCQDLPPYMAQSLNLILFATPSNITKLPDPQLPGVRLESVEELSMVAPVCLYDPVPVVSRIGLTALLDQALETGPTEEIVAHIKHAIGKPDSKQATWSGLPINTNLAVVDAVAIYIGNHAAARAQGGGPVFVADAPDMATLSMVLHELPVESQYFLLRSMVNQLRYPNAHTTFFGQAFFELFGNETTDSEETEIRELICRVFFERVVNYWPQPWGLLVVLIELVKNERFSFFSLPSLKQAPEMSERFASLATRA